MRKIIYNIEDDLVYGINNSLKYITQLNKKLEVYKAYDFTSIYNDEDLYRFVNMKEIQTLQENQMTNEQK